MRNIHVVSDSSYQLPVVSGIVACSIDVAREKVYMCNKEGKIFSLDGTENEAILSECEVNLNMAAVDEDEAVAGEDNQWFSLTVVPEVSLIVGISHSGCIATLSAVEDPAAAGHSFGRQPDRFEVSCEGCVEGGISTVSWSPDQRFLLLLTNNDSLICMTNNWEVVNEIDLQPRASTTGVVSGGHASSISWRGDSEFFAVYTVDACDNVGRVRVYTKDLMYVGMGRDIGDENSSFLRGLGTPVCGFAPSAGGMIAVPRLHKNKQQITLLETSGLHHGEFDLVLPTAAAVGEVLSKASWEVNFLQWHSSQTMLLVGIQPAGTVGEGDVQHRCIQMYCRTNYQWQLKQQVSALELACLGFDSENPYRIYCRHLSTLEADDASGPRQVQVQVFRQLDLRWDLTAHTHAYVASNNLVGVTNGACTCVTPVGMAVIPPPMFKYALPHPSVPRESCFFRVHGDQTVSSSSPGTSQWGVISLCDGHWVSLFLSSNAPRGCEPNRSAVFSLQDLSAPNTADGNTVKRIVASTGFVCRDIVAVDMLTGGAGAELELFVCILGCHSSTFGGDGTAGDSILRLHLSVSPASSEAAVSVELLHCALRRLPGTASGLSSTSVLAPTNGACIAADRIVVGVSEAFGDNTAFNVYALDSARLSDSDDCDDASLLPLGTTPETCCDFSVIPAVTNAANTFHDAVGDCESEPGARDLVVLVGLTSHGRLYCGETLLCPAASSFAVNLALNMVLFVSIGSQTELHFATFQALTVLADSLLNEMQTINTTPRPLERGSRLICTVANNTRVVIQLPRGNLEAFDPRPLVIIYAKKLLAEGAYYRCLQLVRKQRVDMNLLYDYSPKCFMAHAADLVRAAIADGHLDLLSLLISALDRSLFSEHKYALPSGTANPPSMDGTQRETAATTVADGEAVAGVATADLATAPQLAAVPALGANKLNDVCTAIRDCMLPIVYRKVEGGAFPAEREVDTSSITLTALLNPILLTYAKQQPPLLVEALNTIRQITRANLISTARPGTSVNEMQVISSPIVVSSVKYLAFVVSHEALFQAALGECDFELCKAIARQGQMDPKVYLPLLQQFADLDIGAGSGSSSRTLTLEDECSPAYCHMRCRVYLYLSRCPEATSWGMKSLRGTVEFKVKNNNSADAILSKILAMKKKPVTTAAAEDADTAATPNPSTVSATKDIDFSSLGNDLMDTITKHDGYTMAIEELTILAALVRRNKKKLGKIIEEGVIGSMLRRCRMGYGKKCIKSNRYDEGIASYLAAEPVAVEEAILAAKMANYWNQALTIANRYASSIETEELQPNQLAQDICYQFREQLDQAVADSSSMLISNASSAVSQLVGGAFSSAAAAYDISEDTMGGDNPMVIASLCIEYTGDVEIAVTILLQSKRWLEASELALRKRRIDLFQDEVGMPSTMFSISYPIRPHIYLLCFVFCRSQIMCVRLQRVCWRSWR